eukprot:4958145-Pleurochrysis_carterae.AAC.2
MEQPATRHTFATPTTTQTHVVVTMETVLTVAIIAFSIALSAMALTRFYESSLRTLKLRVCQEMRNAVADIREHQHELKATIACRIASITDVIVEDMQVRYDVLHERIATLTSLSSPIRPGK